MRRSYRLVSILSGILVLILSSVAGQILFAEAVDNELLGSFISLIRYSYGVCSDIGYESCLAGTLDIDTFVELLGYGHRLLR